MSPASVRLSNPTDQPRLCRPQSKHKTRPSPILYKYSNEMTNHPVPKFLVLLVHRGSAGGEAWLPAALASVIAWPPTTPCRCPPHMMRQLLFSGASPGFCDFSIWAISSSKARPTFSLYRALASVHPHWSFSDSFLPSSALTCRCSGRKSLLLPTMTIGTDSVPCGTHEPWTSASEQNSWSRS